jgi:hypothetical protein
MKVRLSKAEVIGTLAGDRGARDFHRNTAFMLGKFKLHANSVLCFSQ